MGVTKEQIDDIFEKFQKELDVAKASEGDLTQPEGGDMGWGQNANPKMSAEANKDSGSNKTTKKDEKPAMQKKSPKESTNSVKGENMDDLVFKAKCPKCGDYESDQSGMTSHMKSCPGTSKSLSSWDDRTDSEEIKGKIEVSAFLKSLNDQQGEYLDNMRDAIIKSANQHEDVIKVLTEQVTDIQQSQAKIGIVLKAICHQMKIIEDSPATGPKTETELNKGESHSERNFETGVGKGEEDTTNGFLGLSENPILAKAQISDVLMEMVMKGEAKDTDVIAFESGGFIEPNVALKVQKAIQTHIN